MATKRTPEAELQEIGEVLVKAGFLTEAELEREGPRRALIRKYLGGKTPRAKRPKAVDVEFDFVRGHARITPHTNAGRDWLLENVQVEVPWRTGGSFSVLADVGHEIYKAARRELRVRLA